MRPDETTKIRWWRADSINPPEDHGGKRLLRRFGLPVLMQHMVTQGIPVDEVPGDYWKTGLTDDGYEMATVTCPCGEAPMVEVGSLTGCPGCERFYIFTGGRMAVANSPKSVR
jgi:hypothetical protein